MKHRPYLVIAALLVLGLSLISGSYALYSTHRVTPNVVTTGNIKIEAHLRDKENEDSQGELPAPKAPGHRLDETLTVENTGDNACYVRVALDLKLESKTGGSLDSDVIEFAFNDTDWTKDAEFYYYNKALEPGEETEPLFQSISMKGSAGNEYQEAKAEISYEVYAVQVTNNEKDDVTEVEGWPPVD